MESSIGTNASPETGSLPVSTASDSQSSNSQSESSSVTKERTFTQSELNDFIGRAKHEAVERERRRSQQPDNAQNRTSDQQQTGFQSSNNNNEDHIRKIVAEETQRQREAWDQQNLQRSRDEQAQAVVNKFWNKISTGKEKFDDFEKVTGDINLGSFPNTVHLLAEHVENSAEMLYELGKDRIKMANLEALSLMSPRDAIIQAQRLSQSIKDNEAAGKVRLPNEPLSQMRPSITGTDSGKMSMRDLKSKYRG